MKFRCTYQFCRRILPLAAIEPEQTAEGWRFACPVCACKSALLNVAPPGLPHRFVQPDEDVPSPQGIGTVSL